MKNEFHNRKPTRLKNFDYSSSCAYFLTICTENRCPILSRVVGGDVLDAPKYSDLSPFGIIVDKYIRQIGDFYDYIKIDQYIIMPNHVHIMLLVFDNGASRTSPPTKQHSVVSHFVSTLKRFCNKDTGYNIWQRGFNDHIIRNKEDYNVHLKYISENPMRWYYDNLFVKS